MHRSIGLAILLLVALALLAACSGNKVAGKYISEDNPDDYLELRSDGNFYSQEEGIGISGSYDVDGNEITLSLAIGLSTKARIEGDVIIDEDGERWVKGSSDGDPRASVETAVGDTPGATPLIPVPPAVALAGGFSIAVSGIERTGISAIIHFVITKVAAADARAETLGITLKDDHGNQYVGTLTTDLSGAPPEVVLQATLGFSYSDSVTISMPEQAPIARVTFGDTSEVPLSLVEFVQLDWQDSSLGDTRTDFGSVIRLGKYLQATINTPRGTLTGWEIPIVIQNNEYSPEMLHITVGVQFSDRSIVWNGEDHEIEAPGSGKTVAGLPITIMEQVLNGRIPRVILIYLQGTLRLIPVTTDDFGAIPERIAFLLYEKGAGLSDGFDIIVMEPDGSDRVALINRTIGSTVVVWEPYQRLAWSPNGTRIAFCSRRKEGGWYFQYADGMQRTKLSALPKRCGRIKWSPLGDRLAHARIIIGIVPIDNPSIAHQIVSEKRNDARAGAPLYSLISPSWSPDGSQLVFERDDGIYVVPTDGSTEAIRLGDGEYPSWSPDGMHIAYVIDANSYWEEYRLMAITSDGSNQINISGNRRDMGDDLAWAPTGDRLAITSTVGPHNERFLIVYDLVNGTEVRVEIAEGRLGVTNYVRSISWSPDGSKILIESGKRVLVVAADGSGLYDLGSGESPSWAPSLKLTENGLVPIGVAQRDKASDSDSSAATQPVTIEVKRIQTGGSCSANDPGPVETLDLEEEYLPVVVASENGAAGVPLEALKAQAVASRSFALYKMRYEPRSASFDVCDTQADQVYNPSMVVRPEVQTAVDETRGIVAKWSGEVIAAFFVKGDESSGTAGYVTANEGKSGNDVTPTTLGSATNPHNRGTMSQNKTNELAAQGWDYQRILRYFYGADLELASESK